MYDSERFDCGLVLEQNGNPVPNRVDPLALVALQAFLSAQDERLAAYGTDQDFEQVGRNHDEVIVTREPLFAVRYSLFVCRAAWKSEEPRAKSGRFPLN